MYVVPYVMGPLGSPFSQGRRRADRQRLRRPQHADHDAHGAGRPRHLGASDDFTRGLHSTADLDPERRFICHFPQDNTIWSVGSGYGGNALLGKKCLALRIASYLGRQRGLARRAHAASSASRARTARSRTSRRLPERLRQDELRDDDPPRRSTKGWKIYTVGDDIAWMPAGPGRPAVGRQPRERVTSASRPAPIRTANPNAMTTIAAEHDLHQRRADRPTATSGGRATTIRRRPRATDWQGTPWTPRNGEQGRASEQPLHRAGRANNPTLSPQWQDPGGRADQRDHLRRRAGEPGPARVPGVQLAARRVPRRDAWLGDDGGGDRRGRRRAPRPDGDAAVLRLQHGRLLRALARDGEAG